MSPRKLAPKTSNIQRKQWPDLLRSRGADADSKPDKLTIVIDTNVWIGGLLFGGNARRVLKHSIFYQRVIISSDIVAEVHENLARFRPKQPHKWIVALVHVLNSITVPVKNRKEKHAIRDVKDEFIVQLAREYEAVIITGDKDILEYDGGVSTITVAEYIETYLTPDSKK